MKTVILVLNLLLCFIMEESLWLFISIFLVAPFLYICFMFYASVEHKGDKQ